MIFVELNNGTKVNLVHTSNVELHEDEIIYKQAKGTDIVEKFNSNEEAKTRYESIKKDIVIS